MIPSASNFSQRSEVRGGILTHPDGRKGDIVIGFELSDQFGDTGGIGPAICQ